MQSLFFLFKLETQSQYFSIFVLGVIISFLFLYYFEWCKSALVIWNKLIGFKMIFIKKDAVQAIKYTYDSDALYFISRWDKIIRIEKCKHYTISVVKYRSTCLESKEVDTSCDFSLRHFGSSSKLPLRITRQSLTPVNVCNTIEWIDSEMGVLLCQIMWIQLSLTLHIS